MAGKVGNRESKHNSSWWGTKGKQVIPESGFVGRAGAGRVGNEQAGRKNVLERLA